MHDLQRQERAQAGRWQRREDGDGMDIAFIQHAQNDVDRDQRCENQPDSLASDD